MSEEKKNDKIERIEISEAFEPKLPPKCPKCKAEFNKIEKQSSEYHSSWEPSCGCYPKPIIIHVG